MAMRSTDRLFVLERINPNKKDVGLFDPDVFEGKNALHAVMEPNTMWRCRYERGIPPKPLQGVWTDFKSLKKHAEVYLATKNIRIVEIKD
jgi:hypothetical protein